MLKLQKIKECYENRYEEILKYLKRDDEYWLKNDKWKIAEENSQVKTLNFTTFENEEIKNEVKYFVLFNLNENNIRYNNALVTLTAIGQFLTEEYKNITSIFQITNKTEAIIKLDTHLNKIKSNIKENTIKQYNNVFANIYDFLNEFYDDREETEKDIWSAKNIKGAKIPASCKNAVLNFADIPSYYRTDVKRYFKVVITRRSWNLCGAYLTYIKYFFKVFYENGYKDGFVEALSREDIEKYLYWVNNDTKNKNIAYRAKFVTYIERILEYMQIADYAMAPKKDISKLFFVDDFPQREILSDTIKNIKYVPAPILEQIDNNISKIDDFQVKVAYMLLRESGWRGTDILNLRYNNCLEQIWNTKENKYIYYLCGEITKTDIAELKVPIHEETAKVLKECIEQTRKSSTEENNPNKYLFNIYSGKNKGRPIGRVKIVDTIRELIEKNNILDAEGKPYHFKLHSLRHSRAKEYIEQGLGITIVQQMLGHRSLQMTIHYATVDEDLMYKKWKETEKLQLFKLNNETNKLEEIDTNDKRNDIAIKYECVKENLDAVKVPFGICFKSQKIQCKNQLTHCLTCASFCTSTENIAEYEEEIKKVEEEIGIAQKLGRTAWIEKNAEYLQLLNNMRDRIMKEKLIHKNGNTREEH